MRTLYLHGFGSSPTTSKKIQWLQGELSARDIELEAPVLVPGDFSQITLTEQLEVLEAFLDGDRCRLIGSSLGGLVAANFAGRHPEQVESLVLLAPAFGFPGRWVESIGTDALAEWEESGWRTMYHHAKERDAEVHFGFYEDASSYDAEPAFRQPAIIVHGREDETVPVEYSRRFVAEVASQVELVEVTADHSLGSEEAHAAILAAVKKQFGL